MISIHAPARGATIEVQRDEVGIIDFNSRSREGSDASLSGIFLVFCKFQSALPRGERPCPYPLRGAQVGFQPALPQGERQRNQWLRNQRRIISIRAPTRGATFNITRVPGNVKFQSALPRGERQSPCPIPCRLYYFNPRSREGSDHYPEDKLDEMEQFQSSLPRGERRVCRVDAL